MSIFTALALVVVGLLLLVKGSDYFIDGASEIATRIGVSEVIIGLTLVAFGTSLPEWVSSIIATLRDPTVVCANNANCHVTDLALGNVIGSNITNIGLVIGFVGLMLPNGIKVNSDFLLRDIPLIIILSVATWYFSLQDHIIAQWEGGLIFIGFLAVMIHSIRSLPTEPDDSEEDSEEASGLEDSSTLKLGLMTVGGLIGLLIGSNMLVEGASSIALTMGVPETVVGITMVAFGTSVPELATSITAGKRGKHAMLLGGVIGSNSANLAIILGSVAFLVPVEVTQEFAMREFPIMIAFITALWIFMLSGRINKIHSTLLFIGYLAFTGLQFL
jgi:cation:H+ antiporter